MCGIFASINISGNFSATQYRKFCGLTDIVTHRGPDACGYASLNTRSVKEIIPDKENFNIFLGHHRLSIIDISKCADQPMLSDNCYIVFSGEIFNYVELREELKAKGHIFKTSSDTEVIIKSYIEYGAGGFSKFNGMWAFVLVDLNKRKVIISRDRFSIKPLFFFRDAHTISFASEIKQLLPLLPSRKANMSILFTFLQQGITDHSEQTFFEGISRVKPMSNMVIDLQTGKSTEQQYWQYEISGHTSEEQSVERFRELFYDSINIRLRSDVKIGALLSGGLDSSAITLAANMLMQKTDTKAGLPAEASTYDKSSVDKLAKEGIESFSVIFREKNYSEEKFIGMLCTEKNIANRKLIFDQEMVPENLLQVLHHQDEPFGSFSIVAQYLIFKKIKQDTDAVVLLSGQGGDEAMLGYRKYFFYYLKYLLSHYRLKEFSKQVAGSAISRTALWDFPYSNLGNYLAVLQKKKTGFLRITGNSEDTWKFSDITHRQMLDIDKFSIPSLCRYEDRNSMAFGLEVRHPFLDHRIVNFLLNAASDLKLRNGWTKFLLRHSLHELPDRIRWRRDKKGFDTPDEKWLRHGLRTLVTDSFKESMLGKMGVIDKKQFLESYSAFVNGHAGVHHSNIFRTLIAELWAKKYMG